MSKTLLSLSALTHSQPLMDRGPDPLAPEHLQGLLGPSALLPRRDQLDLASLVMRNACLLSLYVSLLLLQSRLSSHFSRFRDLWSHLLSSSLTELIPSPRQFSADLASMHKTHDARSSPFLLSLGKADLIWVVNAEGGVSRFAYAEDIFPGAGALCKALLLVKSVKVRVANPLTT